MSRRQSIPFNVFWRAADPMPPAWPEPKQGDCYWNTTREVLRLFHEGAWMDIGGGSGGTQAGGQLRYVNALGDTMKGNLDIATEGQSGVYLSDMAGRRWTLYKDIDGSLVLGCYDDTGAWLGAALIGDRMTRLLEVTGPPTEPMGIANKQFVEEAILTTVHNDLLGRSTTDAHPQSAITGLSSRLNSIEADVDTKAKVTISPAAPSSPRIGDIWVNTA